MSATIIDLISDQIANNPNKIALVSNENELTYSELNKTVNQTLRFINKHYKLQTGSKVAFSFSQKPLKILSTILAILKSGALYIPIDPTNPQDRINYLLDQAEPDVVITDKETVSFFSGSNTRLIVLEDSLVEQESSEEIDTPAITPEGVAYLIFTSGSTGNPKGVEVAHKNIYAAYKAWEQEYNLKEIDCHLQVVGYAFDVFSGDWIRGLCSGAKLVMCSEEITNNAAKLYNIIVEQRVECAEFLPNALRKLISYCEQNNFKLDTFKLLVCGSDRWYVEEYFTFKKLLAPHARLVNSYGTSETTIDTSYFEFTNKNLSLRSLVKQVPIGKPFPGMRMYILDENQNQCPPGIVGELYIGGSGVSLGYIKAPHVNKEKFVKIKLDKDTVYRTGDFGLLLPTGDIELVGRNDRQIKHNGRRVNLTEIEDSLIDQQFIDECAVIVHDEENKQIVTCYITQTSRFKHMDGIMIREAIIKLVPIHLVPDVFIVLESMPTNVNGKISIRTLHEKQRA